MRLLTALLVLFAATAATSTTAAAAATAEPGLYGCGTSVKGSTGNGWCSGSGTFRVVVMCEDGRSVRSPWITIQTGEGTLGVSCPGTKATVATIDAR